MRRSWFWDALGIPPGSDIAAIRRGYAEKLKAMDIDADPEAFMALRNARDVALDHVRYNLEPELDDDDCDDVGDGDDDPALITPLSPALPEAAGDTSGDRIAPVTRANLHLEVPPDAIGITLPPLAEDAALFLLDLPEPATGEDRPATLPLTRSVSSSFQAPRLNRPWLAGGEVRRELSLEDQAERLSVLLQSHVRDDEAEVPPLTAEEQREARRYLDNILADPRLQEVDFYAHVEQWIGGLLARSEPRSDSLVATAVAFFRWDEQGQSIHSSPIAQYMARRHRDLQFVYRLMDPSHPHHKAWLDLRRTDGSTKLGFFLTRLPVPELLATVRRDYPGVEAYFDSYRVAVWDGRDDGGGGGFSWSWVFAGFLVLSTCARLIGTVDGPPEPRPAAQQLVDQASSGMTETALEDAARETAVDGVGADTEITDALAAVAPSLDIDELRKRQPKLAYLMSINWRVYHRNNEPERFARGMGELLQSRIQTGLHRADYKLLIAYRTNQRAVIRYLLAKDTKECVSILEGRPVDLSKLSDRLRADTGRVQARVLMETDGEPPQKRFPTSFTVSGKLVGAALDSTGMDEADFRAGMRAKGSDKQRCNTALGLLNAALASPSGDGMTILRSLT